MEIKVDTKHDTHDDIRKVIKMLQHIVGDDASAYQPSVSAYSQSSAQEENRQILSNSGQSMPSDFSEMFANSSSIASAEETVQQTVLPAAPEMVPMPKENKSETDDLFAELFSDEELKKMEPEPVHEAEEERSQKSPYNIEIY